MATIEAAKAESAQTAYDEVPYPSYPFPQTHPARLATVATLFGMRPANVERCGVLEIGCASGGNVIPMAAMLSKSRFPKFRDENSREFSGRVLSPVWQLQLLGRPGLTTDGERSALIQVRCFWRKF